MIPRRPRPFPTPGLVRQVCGGGRSPAWHRARRLPALAIDPEVAIRDTGARARMKRNAQ